MLREVIIEITDKQEQLLKQFIQTDTLATNRPVFIVQEWEGDGKPSVFNGPGWRNVAYFFSQEEARRYTEYQKHNLELPRIYAQSPGYNNEGDWQPFYDLLLSIGQLLNKKTSC